jgi:hypothetical protein
MPATMTSQSNRVGRARAAALAVLMALPLAAWSLPAASAAETVQLLPAQFTLAGPAARQSLLFEAFSGANATGHLGEGAEFVSSDPGVAKIEGNVALPVANGKATITVSAGTYKASAEVNVADMDKPSAWSFRNHVESVLSKAGCNSGACHGALAGKKGFKLSLGAFDPVSDYFFITRQARARRVVMSDPGRSLLLTKPTGAVPHKGGVRFAVDSPEYNLVAQWIAAGAPAPVDSDPHQTRLEVLPAATVL